MRPVTDTRSGFHKATAVALAISAAACLVLMIIAGRQSPLVLAVLFGGWVVLPFFGMAVCHVAAGRTQLRVRIDAVILALSVASVAFYAVNAIRPLPTARALPYLLVPVLSWLVIALIAASIWWSGRRERRSQ
jgi:hypothetical protein